MILTPAPRPEDLQWKRRQADWTAIPLSRAEIDAALAADEAFFAAHPVKRERRRPAGLLMKRSVMIGAAPLARKRMRRIMREGCHPHPAGCDRAPDRGTD